jgi:hypothetical protein
VEERLLDIDLSETTQYDHAMKRIRQLEMELEKSDIAITAAVRDAFHARVEADLMKQKIVTLEEEHEDMAILKVKLKETEIERDRAWSLLHDVKRVVIHATETSS